MATPQQISTLLLDNGHGNIARTRKGQHMRYSVEECTAGTRAVVKVQCYLPSPREKAAMMQLCAGHDFEVWGTDEPERNVFYIG